MSHIIDPIASCEAKIVEGAGRYYVLTDGRIFSASHDKFLRLHHNSTNYPTFYSIFLHKHKLIHRLVAQAFIPNVDNYPEVNHKNGDRRDNNVSNLEWVTASMNHIHRASILKRGIGEENGMAKLSEDDVRSIRKEKKSNKEIAQRYGISIKHASRIKNGKMWGHV